MDVIYDKLGQMSLKCQGAMWTTKTRESRLG